jgi:hypothetical protein
MNKRKKEIRNRQKMFSKFLKTFFYAKIHKKISNFMIQILGNLKN